MATTLADTLKKLGAAALERLLVVVGVVDDDPPTYADGDVKPLLIHKTTRGLIVYVANASGGDAASPSIVQGTDGVDPERLATQVTLDALEKQGRSANTYTFNVLAVTNTAGAFPSIAIGEGRCLMVKNPARNTRTAWLGYANSITAADTGGWPLEPGEEAHFDAENADDVFAISDGAMNLCYRVENRT